EKTRNWAPAVLPVSLVASVAVHDTVPLESANARGSVPIDLVLSGGQSWLVGKAALMAVVPGTQAMPLLAPPTQVPPEQSGQGWMPGMPVLVSPVRWMSQTRETSRLVAPVPQSTLPETSPARRCTTHVLTGGVIAFGIARGAAKRQPALVQFPLLPVWVDVVGPT